MIDVANYGKLPASISRPLIQRTVERSFLVTRRRPTGNVTICFLSDKEIRELNKKYLGKDAPTDVLSFSADPRVPDGRPMKDRKKEWGDILISAATTKRQSAERGVPFKEEVVRLVAHGMLHLFGYDHCSKKQEKQMFAMQERVVSNVA
jgi:probable rRNA maturation factor